MSQASVRKQEARTHRVGNPNLVPIMNLVTILIPFLLLTVTFVHLATVDSTLPAISPIPSPDSESLRMVVAITDEGFVVRGNSPALQPQGDGETIDLARNLDGSYPLDDLQQLMVQVKAAHPEESSVILMPEDAVGYETIIGAMDATRDWMPPGAVAREQLFPRVVLGSLTELD